MLASVLMFLVIFYVGAVIASGRCWLAVWRGAARFSTLRDVTGIGDEAALRRLFGLRGDDGSYPVSVAEVLRHRRRAGIILTDLPVHSAFLLLLAWAAADPGSASAQAVIWAAGAHALIVGLAALTVLARARQALAG